MNDYNNLGLVCIIIFHRMCKERVKKGYRYTSYFWETSFVARLEARGSSLLQIPREDLVKRAKKAKGSYKWNSPLHISFIKKFLKDE